MKNLAITNQESSGWTNSESLMMYVNVITPVQRKLLKLGNLKLRKILIRKLPTRDLPIKLIKKSKRYYPD